MLALDLEITRVEYSGATTPDSHWLPRFAKTRKHMDVCAALPLDFISYIPSGPEPSSTPVAHTPLVSLRFGMKSNDIFLLTARMCCD
jgi:hypothetical protein